MESVTKEQNEAASIIDTAMYLVLVGGVELSVGYTTSLIKGNEVKIMLEKAEEHEVEVDITWVPVEVALAGKELLKGCEEAKKFMEDKKNYNEAWTSVNKAIKLTAPHDLPAHANQGV